ncbi:hypothetical protein M406DRAFT_355210 [Cryphonectria parasitica EP155]|uniref:Uncharacterized protein n=1 Tax=Cryphonectria parasitica (strain ATCC 38755 / EP155) TaxID=660469 RepID=A0A9P4YAP6_CRYP1|nr:uncharacterized protein M406DRAFT_355210 [Cryphonectria parasitica EP155]KAF3769185.1 hypothetical protein M406DRAFT_355210 [Cryphonectria parasitica EP155]
MGPAAPPGPESTYASVHMSPPSSQLPGFPDFMNQLPREISFQPDSYTASRPPPN